MRTTGYWLTLVIFAGCSSNSGDPDAAVSGDVKAADMADAADHGAPDQAADVAPGDATPDLTVDVAPLPTYAEQEPNNGSTDTEFNAITLPTEVTGAIGEANDTDLFRFSANAGDRLRFNIKSDGPLQPHLAIFGAPPLDVPVVVNKGSSDLLVELYAIKDGNYLLAVRDQRNVADSSAGEGGASFTYSLEIEALTRAPQPAAVGGVIQSKLEPAGIVRVFSFDAVEGDDLTVKVVAEQLSPPSDVDSRLSLFNPAQGVWLGTNDNPTLSDNDSVMKGEMPFTGTYHAIVENVAESGSDYRFSLEITKSK